MQAVIMCGGVGSRLKPLTEVTPKPLVKLLGVELLETIIGQVRAAGVGEIHLSLGYKANEIEGFCDKRFGDGALRCRTEETPLGTAGGVKNCLPTTAEDVLVLSGDNVIGFDLKRVLQEHLSSGRQFSVVCTNVKDPREYGVVIKNDGGRILGFREKPSWENAETFLVNTGVYVFSGKLLSLVPSGKAFDFSRDLIPLLMKNDVCLNCIEAEGLWGDVGEPRELLRLTKELLSSGCEGFPFRGKLYTEDKTLPNGGRIMAPSIVSEDLLLEAGACVGPFAVVGRGCELGKGASARDCILGDNVRLSEGAELRGAIADDNVVLGARTAVEEGCVLGRGVRVGRYSRVLSGCRIWPGRNVGAEEIVSRDLFFSTPLQLRPDGFGVKGRPFTELGVPDAVKIGQALASVRNMRRVGVGHDASKTSALYKDACAAGLRAAGAICYDFEEMFRAQAWFYSAYCSLDAFVFLSEDRGELRFSFFGENGLPVNERTSREIERNYRFSTFSAPEENRTPELFRMHLLSTAYGAALRKISRGSLPDRSVRVSCKEPLILSTVRLLLPGAEIVGPFPPLEIVIGETGEDLYCVENDNCYPAGVLRTALSETLLENGVPVVLPEDAPEELDAAERSAALAKRLFDNADNDVDANSFLHSLWNFDAVFLCFTLLSKLAERGVSLAEFLENRPSCVCRGETVELNADPAAIKRGFSLLGAQKISPSDVYYRTRAESSRIRLRQLGNSARVRILVESASAETAKELTGDVIRRLEECLGKTDVDKIKKI